MRISLTPSYFQVVYSYTKRKEVLELLEEHITENIVKVPTYIRK